MLEDKQIIIDGVDVSGCHNKTFYKNDEGDVQCKCYRFEDADSDTLLFGICKQHPHCYYKQLKRKEQECERLKHDNGYEVGALERTIDNLKAENDELEKELRQKKMTILMNNDHYFEVDQENKKLKQTLTEIKEIAEKCCIMQAILDCENYDDCTQCGRISDGEGIQQILQKISEVEDETN